MSFGDNSSSLRPRDPYGTYERADFDPDGSRLAEFGRFRRQSGRLEKRSESGDSFYVHCKMYESRRNRIASNAPRRIVVAAVRSCARVMALCKLAAHVRRGATVSALSHASRVLFNNGPGTAAGVSDVPRVEGEKKKKNYKNTITKRKNKIKKNGRENPKSSTR